MQLSPKDQLKLAHAVNILGNPSFTNKVTKTVGRTVEKAVGIFTRPIHQIFNSNYPKGFG